jgi:hypothetical protein
MASEPTNPSPQPSPATTVGELRRQYGPHFARSYGDQDTWGEIAGRAGVSTLEEYLEQSRHA